MFAGLRQRRGDQRPLPLPAGARARPASPPPSTSPPSTAATADDPLSYGEFGKCGVGVSSLADMEILFDGIPLDQVTTSMTINGPAAGGLGVLHRRGREARHPARQLLGGTTQNDILKEYIAQNTFIYPPEPSMRLVVDTIEFATKEMPQLEPGLASAATTSARRAPPPRRSWPSPWPTASTYVEWCVEARAGRGRLRAAPLLLLQRPQRLLRGDRQVPRRPPHLGARAEGALRGARTRARCGCASTRRRRAQSLTAQQPEINIVRTTIQALAGRARRHAVAAHQLDGRGAGPAVRQGGAHRPAHAADHRRGERRHQHGRPAGRLATSSRR